HNLDAAESKNHLELACVRFIQGEVECVVKELWKEKGAEQWGPGLARLISAQKGLKTKLLQYKRPRRGVLSDAVQEYNCSEGNDKVTADNFQFRLGNPGDNVVYWIEAVEKHFDETWRRAAASFYGDHSSQDLEKVLAGTRISEPAGAPWSAFCVQNYDSIFPKSWSF
ncbi:hypothetical protein EC968_008236, partial [Mortierella alpina]